jgi:MazG family protein
MSDIYELKKIIQTLRSEHGCPWDRRQTHMSLKSPCIEEAAEVICGINILEDTGDADNLKEELGDLLMQIVMHACIAEEEGLFTLDDVIDGISEKMIRRHPHVFAGSKCPSRETENLKWEEIKAREKQGKIHYDSRFLKGAFDESKGLIEIAKKRKGFS